MTYANFKDLLRKEYPNYRREKIYTHVGPEGGFVIVRAYLGKVLFNYVDADDHDCRTNGGSEMEKSKFTNGFSKNSCGSVKGKTANGMWWHTLIITRIGTPLQFHYKLRPLKCIIVHEGRWPREKVIKLERLVGT